MGIFSKFDEIIQKDLDKKRKEKRSPYEEVEDSLISTWNRKKSFDDILYEVELRTIAMQLGDTELVHKMTNGKTLLSRIIAKDKLDEKYHDIVVEQMERRYERTPVSYIIRKGD